MHHKRAVHKILMHKKANSIAWNEVRSEKDEAIGLLRRSLRRLGDN